MGVSAESPLMTREERAAIKQTICRGECVKSVRAFLDHSSRGFGNSWLEKGNQRLGDRVASGLLQIYGSERLTDFRTIRVYLPVVRAAFSEPCLIDESQSVRPRSTLALMHWLSAHNPDPTLGPVISNLIDELEASLRFDLRSCPAQTQAVHPWQKTP